MRKLCRLLMPLLLLALPAHADWTASASASARYSDNVGNTGDSDDKRSDEILAAKVSLFDVLPFGSAYQFSAGADLDGEWFDQVSGLRNASIDAAVSLRRRWGLGAMAPWVRVSLSVGRTDYDVSLRDYTGYRASIAGGKRLGERLNLWVDYSFENRESKITGDGVAGFSGDVFSGNAQSLGVALDYTLVSRLFLNAGIALRRGDVVSTAEPDYGIYVAARAIVEDPVFGDEHYAYRLVGNSYSLRTGLGYQLTEHSLLSVSVQHARTYAGGFFYRVTSPEITWNYQF